MFKIFGFGKKRQGPDAGELRDALEIRMEAIGGQGANSAGKILAEAAVLGMGYTGQHFSSFGSEKRGSPVKSFVRFYRDRRAVRSSSPVTRPGLLIVFHQALMVHNSEILDGTDEKTWLLVNSERPPGKIQFPEGVALAGVAAVDASEIAQRLGCGLNSVLLGAMIRICREIDGDKLEEALLRFFGKLDEKKREAIRAGFIEGRERCRLEEFKARRARLERPNRKLPRLGWENAPIGGVIVNPGNTVLRDLSASRRGTVPALDRERCIHCGLCDMVCPDYCFVWTYDPEKAAVPVLEGIDYQYCKGCQKCVEVCPMDALQVVPDQDEFTRTHRVPRFGEVPVDFSPPPASLSDAADGEKSTDTSDKD